MHCSNGMRWHRRTVRPGEQERYSCSAPEYLDAEQCELMPDWRLFRVKSCSAWRLIQSCYHPRETKAMAAACGRRSVAGGVQWRRVARGQERSTSAPDSGIEQLLHSENELLPPKSLVQNARMKDYAAEYKRSIEDPEAFWAAAAKELEWFRP